ncbi:MAG: hypothetical protein KIB49_00995 [Clostridiales bacterium]|nr:hypothetical protein [Clostridiales bacterium]
MAARVHGVYDDISETYKAVLQLIGSGWRKDQLVLITAALPVTDDQADDLDRRQVVLQKSLLETVFPLRTYSQAYVGGLCEAHKTMLLPYQADLDAGRIVLVLSNDHSL